MALISKPSSTRNFFVGILSIGVLFVLSINFVSRPENVILSINNAGISTPSSAVFSSDDENPLFSSSRDLWTSKEWRKIVNFYSSRFQDLIFEGLLSLNFKALCVETPRGEDVFALKEIGVNDSIGIFKKAFPPLVRFGEAIHLPFDNSTFDFVFCGNGRLDRSDLPFQFVSEIGRVLKPNGVVVVYTRSVKDLYSLDSFLRLFDCCKFVVSRKIRLLSFTVKEIVLRKKVTASDKPVNKCSLQGYRKDIIGKVEPLIKEEPLKPWITLKRNVNNIKYLPSMADISFKRKYVYIDVGARSYGSSIGSWFKKQYPKQNKTFDIYAIEADRAFHEEYKRKKNVKLLPYAAWVRNETLFFEINRDPVQKNDGKRRGMGRIQTTIQSSFNFMGDLDKIRGFDFAHWLKNTVSEKDFVVMKMDVEGTEFDLIPKLFETGAICLIDEIFLECHYNRWQKCCPGKRSPKYQKTYAQCLDLFSFLRKRGILVHQWW